MFATRFEFPAGAVNLNLEVDMQHFRIVHTARDIGRSILVSFGIAACSADGVVPPPPAPLSDIDVTIENLAPGRDRDGYVITLASNASFTVANDATTRLRGVPAGVNAASLTGIGANCEVIDGASRTFEARADAVAAVGFKVSCGGGFSVQSANPWKQRVLYVNRFGEPITITNDTFFNVLGRWAPDGAALLFERGRQYATEVPNAYRAEIDLVLATPDGSSRLVASNAHYGPFHPSQPSFLFLKDFELYIARTDGSDSRPFADSARTGAALGFAAWWSPTGDRVLLSRPQLWLLSTADREFIRNLNVDANDAAWSPDGARIAFTANDAGLRIINSNGTGQRLIASDYSGFGELDWANNDDVLYIARETVGKHRLAAARADGGGTRYLTPPDLIEWFSRSADGKYILLAQNGLPYVLGADGIMRRMLVTGPIGVVLRIRSQP